MIDHPHSTMNLVRVVNHGAATLNVALVREEKLSGFRRKGKTKLTKWCTPIADNQSSEKEGVELRSLRDF